MPLGIAILTFFGLEYFLMSYPGSISGDLFFGLIGSGAGYLLLSCLENKKNAKRDNQSSFIYELPTAQTFSIILSTLKSFRAGERRWVISELDRNNYSITAFSEWHDQSLRKYNRLLFEQPLFRQIKLRISMRRKGYRLTELAMIWTVHSPLTRSECNAVQNYTTQILKNALKRAEIERAEKFKSAY